MDGLLGLLRLIIATPFLKLRTLLKKSHEETNGSDDVSKIQPELGLQKSSSTKLAFNQTSEGIVIVPNDLAIGERRNMGKTDESMEFRYIGNVQYGNNKMDVLTHDNYPFILIPITGIPILDYNPFEGIVSGVSEPKLFNALQRLKEIESEIKVIRNVSLPIKTRNYGYKPDIAILWKSKGIAIDVEIDEPYDMKSREPIHCIDEEKDYIRNAYFLENGWFVIRIAEEQVIKNVDGIYGYVSTIISAFAKDERFSRDYGINPVKRWSKEEAKKMAEDGYRDSYLPERNCNLIKNDANNSTVDDYITPPDFVFKKPTIEIINICYDELSNKIKEVAEGYTYIRIKRSEDGYEYITTKESIKFSAIGLTLTDVVEDKEFYLPYANIDSYVGLDIIRIEKGDLNWHEFVYNTMVHCRPIHIKYEKTSEPGPTERTVLYIKPFLTYTEGAQKYIEKHSKMGWLRFVSYGFHDRLCNYHNMSEFSGFCLYRKDLRMFNSSKILDGYAYDCYKPLVKHDTKEVLQVLEKGDGRLAEIIYSHFTNEEKNDYANIANNGHALVMQGKYDDALKYYFKFPEKKVIFDNVTWRQGLFEDIENFSKNEIYGSKFDHVKKFLYDNEEWSKN